MSQNSGEHAEGSHAPQIRIRLTSGQWLAGSSAEQEQLRYQHTLREILQQPQTWLTTAAQVLDSAKRLQALLTGCEQVVLTGSGSSEYAGECVRIALQRSLRLPVQTLGSGSLLTNGSSLLPQGRALMISFARSGDSPESVAALQLAQRLNRSLRQLIITCNQHGQLSTTFPSKDDLESVVLDERTNDRSLVMTSSFTNMALAALALCCLDAPKGFQRRVEKLSEAGDAVLRESFERLPMLLEEDFDRAFYLASPSLFGAAREAALKMTEMTAGRVTTVCETYLGLRHGPMSAIHSNSLVVCFLSADPQVRAYELDLIRELNEKQLGRKRLFVGSNVPSDVVSAGDVVLNLAGADEDEFAFNLYVVAGQVLALLRCLQVGLRPDAPSENGVITRVVGRFRIYEPEDVLVS